jgi:hypothetical protein
LISERWPIFAQRSQFDTQRLCPDLQSLNETSEGLKLTLIKKKPFFQSQSGWSV